MATMQDCITDCLDCHSVCLATIGHCLQKGGEHAEPAHNPPAPRLCADLHHQRGLHAARLTAASDDLPYLRRRL